jgi:hypothetical protein
MPADVRIGQKWSAWVPNRGQWLLATVVRRKDGLAILQYDSRYGIGIGQDEHKADETTMLENKNLFRLISP